MQSQLRERQAVAFREARTASALRSRAIRGLVIGSAAAFVLAYAAAMGTGDAPFGRRFLFWLLVILPGSALGLLMTVAVQAWGGLAKRWWVEVVVVAVLVAVPHCFIVLVITALMVGISLSPLLVAEFFAAVLLFSLALTAINHLASQRSAAADPPNATSLSPSVPNPSIVGVLDRGAATAVSEMAGEGLPAIPDTLAERLPPKLRSGRLIALEAEDHYLRVHTDLGSDLVLMRMADAVDLLADVSGSRVHRSWWVARAAVEALHNDGGRARLKLAGGLEAPVSRAVKPELVAAGWGV